MNEMRLISLVGSDVISFCPCYCAVRVSLNSERDLGNDKTSISCILDSTVDILQSAAFPTIVRANDHNDLMTIKREFCPFIEFNGFEPCFWPPLRANKIFRGASGHRC